MNILRYFLISLCLMAGISAWAQTVPEENKIYTMQDTVMSIPQFPGGDGPMLMYLNEKIGNQKLAGSDQPVFCTFLISRYGEIDYSGIKFLHKQEDGSYTTSGPATPYEKAVLQAVKQIPGFIPAETFDYSVAFQYVMPINANIEEYMAVNEAAPQPKVRTASEPYVGGTRHGPSRADGIYTMTDRVEAAPEYPGGAKAIYADLKKVLKTPHVYSHQKRIYCSFVILPNGQIDKETIKCLRVSDGHYHQAEQYTTWEKCIMEAVAELTGFTPARDDGHAVPYEYVLPFVFGR